jgi:hypothetical protein
MSMRGKLTLLLWGVAAAAAFAVSALGVIAAQDGKLSVWALVAFAWSAAMLAGLGHHLSQHDAATRYRQHHKPLAGPRPGAELPG